MGDMYEDRELESVLHIAGQVFAAVASASQTFSHAGQKKTDAIEIAARDSVRVARRIIAHALAEPAVALAPPAGAPAPTVHGVASHGGNPVVPIAAAQPVPPGASFPKIGIPSVQPRNVG
jgi:hypothetical protein